jgi:hypothetical protein
MFKPAQIIEFILSNSFLLFRCDPNTPLKALFDNSGFFFSEEADGAYREIKNSPHLYVAYSENPDGHFYIGESFQQGGRWKRSHSYHLGTLAHHLLDNILPYDQNHERWVEHWMNTETLEIAGAQHSILLNKPVYIKFIPFEMYSPHPIGELTRDEIKNINQTAQNELIEIVKNGGFDLLNNHHN